MTNTEKKCLNAICEHVDLLNDYFKGQLIGAGEMLIQMLDKERVKDEV